MLMFDPLQPLGFIPLGAAFASVSLKGREVSQPMWLLSTACDRDFGALSLALSAACQVQFFTRSRLLRHVQRYSAGCRLFYLNFVARASRELTQEADGLERARLRQTRGRGRLDRAAARVERATAVTLAASDSEEEQLFYLEDLL